MKKITIICILIGSFVSYCFSQNRIIPEFSIAYTTNVKDYKTIDTAKYEISYSLKYISNLNSSFEKVLEDICILQIGTRISKTYSKLIYDNDSATYEIRQKQPKASVKIPPGVPPIEVFKGFPFNKCTVTRITIGGTNPPTLKYSEDMPVFDWKITNQKKEIQGHSCILATMNFRGRDYEAWFTPDIPLQEGPWKFGGLPGLIMAIKDTQDHYVFECIGIKQAKSPILIKYFNRRYEECSREKFRVTMKKMYDNPVQWVKSIGDRGIAMGREELTNVSFVYNPIELK